MMRLFGSYPVEFSPRLVEYALDGHPLAVLLCVERMLPPRRSQPIPFDLPPIRSTADVAPAIGAILGTAARGEISTSEAVRLTRRVENLARMVVR